MERAVFAEAKQSEPPVTTKQASRFSAGTKPVPEIRPETQRSPQITAEAKRVPAITAETKRRPPTQTKARPPKGQDESKFDVQAIAWSRDPGARIAVINGQVLREGGSIEGATVTRIGMDEIDIKEGSKSWKLRCKAK
jgi:hypothetical protein